MKKLFASSALILLLSSGVLVGLASAAGIKTYSASLRPGQYSGYSIEGPYTGMHSEGGAEIGEWDYPEVFGWPEHVEAGLLWFTTGWLSWNYPVIVPLNADIQSVSYTAEISSEYPGANWSWPSDVTLSLNGTNVGTWTMPGDPTASYGFARLPNNLGSGASQYGWLTTWTVDKTGTYLEYKFRLGDMARVRISDVTLEQIRITSGSDLVVKLSVPGQASGFGLNMYGRTWGDYPNDPTITVTYLPVIQVAIDIKPGSFPNSINLGSGGAVPVAILGSPTFDAATVDPATVTFGGASVAVRGKGTLAVNMEDVNSDGLQDMVLHISTDSLELSDDTSALLTGKTLDGAVITGSDTIRIVPQ